MTAIVEDRLKRVAGKALKLDIGPREESSPICRPSCYREKNVELRVDVVPDHMDFDAVRVCPTQVACEMAGPFGQIIGRKLVIHAATSDSALVPGHTDDHAALVVLIQGFNFRERVIELFEARPASFEVVQPLCPFIIGKTSALLTTADQPLNFGHLQIEERT